MAAMCITISVMMVSILSWSEASVNYSSNSLCDECTYQPYMEGFVSHLVSYRENLYTGKCVQEHISLGDSVLPDKHSSSFKAKLFV